MDTTTNPNYLGHISPGVIYELNKLHLTLDHLWLISLMVNDPKALLTAPDSVIATLERKNYLAQGVLTDAGRKLWDLLLTIDTTPDVDIKRELKKVKLEHDSKFIEWWKAYPTGNTWRDDEEHGEKLYKGSRGFKTRQDDCEKLYLKALTDGNSHQDMLDAINYEVEEKKRESRRTGQNKLDYMVNTYTYLYNKLYISFIEMMKLEKGTTSNKTKPQSSSANTMLV